jgi:hypothetical protein
MKQVYLLGAGFTRSIMGQKAFLTDEIMPKLSLSGFPEIMEDYEKMFPDIEQFITELDLRCLRFAKNNLSFSKRLDEIRDNIVEQIVRMYDVDALSVDDLDKFTDLKKFIETVPVQSTILALNYDLVLDQGLWLSKRWHPCKGYDDISSSSCYGDENREKDNILLLKLHGSCNFRKSSLYGSEYLVDNEYPVLEINDKIFPGIHSSHGAVQDSGPHVLVMSYLKIPHNGIMQLWRKALEALTNADKLTIIGCSLRDEDTFLKFALYHFGMKENIGNFAIEIIDKGIDNCKNIETKIKNLVAYPDKQDITLYDGLVAYLEGENA